ncbi:DUF3034 family protein [Fretibacter rubidus]|uniref:DUF3034 family protein n=1 Tax=Fretibacter rubidus TaxID=570162 RepID=UPI00352A65C8
MDDTVLRVIALISITVMGLSSCAAFDAADSGRLLATGGVSQVEGAGGAGLAPWALITGYGTEGSYGANAFYTRADLPDFTLESIGASTGISNRVEFSYAKQKFDTGDTGPALGLRRGYSFEQDIIGAKVRVVGDAVYDQDRWTPQISVGAQYKKASDPALLGALGAKDDDGLDVYVSATKLLLDKNLLLSATLRGTKANQMGLLGFGGDQNDDYAVQFEGSAAYMVSRNVVLGADYRTKPDNLGFAKEQDAKAAYIAYFPNKNLSLTAAYVDVGEVALQGKQSGVYGSIQVGF